MKKRARKEKVSTPVKMRVGGQFKDMRVHSDDIRDFKVDSEPSFRMKAESDEAENRADIELRKLVSKKGVFPSYGNAGLKTNIDRRYR